MSVDTLTRALWPADESAPLDRRAIGTVLADLAGNRPDHPAVRWWTGGGLATLTYATLYDRATAMASRFLALTDRAPIAIAAAASPDWVVAEYAAALAGTPLVPVNPALTDTEIDHILRASGCAAVLADVSYRDAPLLSRIARLATPAHALACWRDLPSTSDPLPTVASDDAFLVQFTSGTTGRPKGAVLSHRAAFNCARLSFERVGGNADDTWLNVMPLHHVGGSVSVALSVLSTGGTLVLVPQFDAGAVLDLLARSRATVIGTVPTMQLALLEHPAFPTADLSALRLVQSGGSVVPPSLIRRVEDAFGAVVVNAYGQSESPNAVQTSPTDDDLTKAETIGRPNPRREVRIVRPDGVTADLGEPGELWMRSPLTMDRYVGVESEISAQTLDIDGWLHTGDLCSIDTHGVVRIHGRLRDVIIRGGENIYPAEVEAVLLEHAVIADVAVIGFPDERWGEVPVACYRATGRAVDEADLDRFARERLASFKVPRRWVAVDALPMTASGKVKKFELRALLDDTGKTP